MKAELEIMVEQGDGVIINNASVVGHRATESHSGMSPANTASLTDKTGCTSVRKFRYSYQFNFPGPTFTEIQQPLVDHGADAVAEHLRRSILALSSFLQKR